MAGTAGVVALSVLWTVGEERPIGVALGGSVERQLADWRPTCCGATGPPPPDWVGLVGVEARVELRALRTPWLLLCGTGGVGSVDIASTGYAPVFAATLATGLAASPKEAGLHVGGRLVKDLSPCFVGCGGTALAARGHAGTEVVGGMAGMHATAPTLGVGPQLLLTPRSTAL